MDDLLLIDVCDRGLSRMKHRLQVICSRTFVAAECVCLQLVRIGADVVFKPIEVYHFQLTFLLFLAFKREIILNQRLICFTCDASLQDIFLFLYTGVVAIVQILRPPIDKVVQKVLKLTTRAMVTTPVFSHASVVAFNIIHLQAFIVNAQTELAFQVPCTFRCRTKGIR
jgi:hypothetical protein